MNAQYEDHHRNLTAFANIVGLRWFGTVALVVLLRNLHNLIIILLVMYMFRWHILKVAISHPMPSEPHGYNR